MRPHGKTKLGFFPLPVPEAERLKSCLFARSEFSALDPCVGDGVAFTHLLRGGLGRRLGVEIDAYRAEQARNQGIETLQASTFDVRGPAEAFSLLYLNPPYDFEIGALNNQRLELVFLEHTYRWLKPGGVLVSIVSPQPPADVAKGHDARFAWFIVEPNREELIQIGTLIEAGHLRPIIDTVFPLAQARQAYEQGARGHTRGKIVLRVGD